MLKKKARNKRVKSSGTLNKIADVYIIMEDTEVKIVRVNKKGDNEVETHELKGGKFGDGLGEILGLAGILRNEKVELLLGNSVISITECEKIESRWQNKYIPQKILDEARLRIGKSKETSYVAYKLGSRDGDINIYHAEKDKIDAIVKIFEEKKLYLVGIRPISLFVGEKFTIKNDGYTLIINTTKDIKGERKKEVYLFDGSFVAVYRELYEEKEDLIREVKRIITYIYTVRHGVEVCKIYVPEDELGSFKDIQMGDNIVGIRDISTIINECVSNEKIKNKRENRVNQKEGGMGYNEGC